MVDSSMFCFGRGNDGTRVIVANSPTAKENRQYCDNTISNTKYKWWNFLFKALLEQFSLHMNQYFLMLAILQLWSEITPISPIATWTPLIVLVSIGVAKEGLDDFYRWKRDYSANSKLCTVIRKGNKIPSYQVRVGDLLYVQEHEEIRADMVLLQSSSAANGLAYIETAALDGERDYKEKRAVRFGRSQIEDLRDMNAIIECEQPNPEFDRFNGTMTVDNSQKLSLSCFEMLLQGTFLKNTDWACGIVIYTGNESKLGKSKRKATMKWTKTDIFLNRATLCIFIFQICVMISLGIAGNLFMYKNFDIFYLGYNLDAHLPWYYPIIIPLRFLLLCSLLIPQSLKMTSDLMKYGLSSLIPQDIKIYDAKTDTPTLVSNSDTAEELGQIDYLFCDKTGTLTQNVMEFKKCVIDSKHYEYGISSDNLVESRSIEQEMSDGNQPVIQFMRTLLLCNTVFSSISPIGEICYRSQSPDEEALVNFAKKHGAVLEFRDHTSIHIKILHQSEKYDIIKVLGFNSSRKRMSIIVKAQQTGQIYMYTKGADDVIMSRLSKVSESIAKETSKSITEFALEGLRTLCIAMKSLTQEEYDTWERELNNANMAIHNRDENVEQTYNLIESNLTFLGASAIEDALQDQVPDVIQSLRYAGIVIWMLTGDKLETAIQISYSCKLIGDPSSTKLLYLQGNSILELKASLDNNIVEARQNISYKDFCLIVEGKYVHLLFSPEARVEQLENRFVDLVDLCKSVVCCRLNPMQKGQIVKLMKGGIFSRRRTLAIGDGGNDVAMLREADVGVGISGKEGLQAVRAADYGIGEFKFLKRLVLVHGANSHRRMAQMAHYTMYKSWLISLNQLFFSFFSNFSGAPVLDSYVLTTYNSLFTLFLPFIFMFDKHVSDSALEQIPELYKESQKGKFLNATTLFSYFLYAIYSCIISTTFILLGYQQFGYSGRLMDHGSIGYVFLTVLMLVNITIIVFSAHNINWITIIALLASMCLFVALTVTWSILPISSFASFHGFIHLISDPVFYFIVTLVVLLIVLPFIVKNHIIQQASSCITHEGEAWWCGIAHDLTEFVAQEESKKRAEEEVPQNEDLPNSFYRALRRRIISEQRNAARTVSRYAYDKSVESMRLLSPHAPELVLSE